MKWGFLATWIDVVTRVGEIVSKMKVTFHALANQFLEQLVEAGELIEKSRLEIIDRYFSGSAPATFSCGGSGQ